MAKAYDTRLIDIFDPEGAPARGMNTSMSAFGLQDGWFPLLRNIRLGDGTLRCRGGQSASIATVMASGTFMGAATLNINGTETMFVATLTGGAVRVYKSTTGSSFATEVTAGSGEFGNTRLTDTGRLVSFSTFRTPRSLFYDMVLIQNGTDTPRVYNTSTNKCSKHEAIGAPHLIKDYPVQLKTNGYFDIKSSANTTYSGGAGGITMADATLSGGSATTDNVVRVSIANTVANNDSVTCTFSATASFGTGGARATQLFVGLDTAYTEFWNRVKLAVGAVVIWDPSDASYPPPRPVPVDNTQKTIWVFDLPVIATLASGTYSTIVLTYKATSAAAPSTTKTADIFLFCKGGSIEATTQVAAHYYHTNSVSSSPHQVYDNYETQRVSDVGGPVLKGLRLPKSPILKYTYSVPYMNTATGERDAGVNSYEIWLKRPRDGRFKHQTNQIIATYVPGWTYSQSSASTTPYYVDVTLGTTDATDYGFIPDAFHIPIPVGRCSAWVSDRLMVGLGSLGSIYISDRRDGSRFRVIPRTFDNGQLDPDSGLVVNVGNDSINAICPLTASVVGSSTVVIFGEKFVYAISGTESYQLTQATNTGNPGTYAPGSISFYRNALFYLDRENRVRMFDRGSANDITSNIFDDQFSSVPAARRHFVWGQCANDLYYVSYSASGQTTNTYTGVYDIQQGSWTRDTPAVPIEGMLNWYDDQVGAKAVRLITFGVASSDLKAYEYDLMTQSQDLGTTNISVGVTTKEYRESSGKALFINRIGVTCDDVSGSTTNAITRTYKPDGATGVSNLSIDGSGNQIVQYDGTQTQPAGSGISASINLTLGMTAGKRIYKIVAELEPRDHVYTRSS